MELTFIGIPCLGLNGGPAFQPSEAFSFQVATDDQAETDRPWNATQRLQIGIRIHDSSRRRSACPPGPSAARPARIHAGGLPDMRLHGIRCLSLIVATLTMPSPARAAEPRTVGGEDPPQAAVDATPPPVYVPGALAGDDPQIQTFAWAQNNGSTDAVVRPLVKWNPSGEHDLALSDPVTIAPGDAKYLYVHTVPDPRDAVQFLALSVPPGVVIRAALQRVQAADFAGTLTLPTFTALVPAGTRTIAGNFRASWAECMPPGVPRRLNVTLFNAGDAPATFHVVVRTRDHGIDTGPPSRSGEPTEADYVVPARTVRQINDVPYDVSVLCSHPGWEMGWVEITADQAYLAYASTVREAAAGILPYEVFPAVAGR